MHSQMKEYRVVEHVVTNRKLISRDLFFRERLRDDVDQSGIEVARARPSSLIEGE